MTPRLSREGTELLADFVALRTGLVFAPHRRTEFERGLARAFSGQDSEDPAVLLELLRGKSSIWDRLMDEITVGETYFFREPEHFEFVRRVVMPEVIRTRGATHPLRVWSAGCASGEEAYSLAICLHQLGLLSQAFVLGTDLSCDALERAAQGVYRKWSLRGVDAATLEPYFVPQAGGQRVRDDIRARVDFQRLNLAEASYPSLLGGTYDLDLIFCRNVFIYLNAETIRRVAGRLYESLAPGGYLVMGPSDPLLPEERLEVHTTDAGIVYRKPVADASAQVPPAFSVAPAGAEEPRLSVSNELRAKLITAPPRSRAERSAPPAPRAVSLDPAEIRALSNRAGAAVASRACRHALESSPLSVELHYLSALLLSELGEIELAASALRRVLYLDETLAIAHFTLGTLLTRAGDREGALRAFRNAEYFSAALPADAELELSDGVSALGLARAARHELDSARRGAGGTG